MQAAGAMGCSWSTADGEAMQQYCKFVAEHVAVNFPES